LNQIRIVQTFFFISLRLIKQPRFPEMTRNHVHQFYHSCLYNKDDTKKAFQRYVEVDFYLTHQKHTLFLYIFPFSSCYIVTVTSIITRMFWNKRSTFTWNSTYLWCIVCILLFIFNNNIWFLSIYTFLEYRSMVALPELTKEGYRILTYRLQIYNLSHITFGNGVKVSVDELINKNTYFNCFFFLFQNIHKTGF
jgi:hypothetical protein